MQRYYSWKTFGIQIKVIFFSGQMSQSLISDWEITFLHVSRHLIVKNFKKNSSKNSCKSTLPYQTNEGQMLEFNSEFREV